MLPAAPMDRQHHLAGGVIDIGNDVGDKRAQQPLPGPHVDAGSVPCACEIIGLPAKIRHGLGRV
ncbi:MAG: hypothetical protein WCJ64_22470 [Rhodospirillaceae bacterium]